MKRFFQFITIIVVVAALVILYLNKGRVPVLMKNITMAGSYYGILPCADCEGIETVFTVESDSTYTLKRRYLGKSNEIFTEKGLFRFKENTNKIMLYDQNDSTGVPHIWMRVDNRKLIILDQNGSAVKGEYANRYEIFKEMTPFVEISWKIDEVFDSAILSRSFNTPILFFELIDRVANGSVLCGNLSASYRLSGEDLIEFNDVRITSNNPNCRHSRTDENISRALRNTKRYKLQLGKLLLLDSTGNIIMRLSSEEPSDY